MAGLVHSTDIGYSIRVKERDAENGRPAGYVVEVHFYRKQDAVAYASELFRAAQTIETCPDCENGVCDCDQCKGICLVCRGTGKF